MSERRKRKKKKSFVTLAIYAVSLIIVCFLIYKVFNIAFSFGKGMISESSMSQQEVLGEEVNITIPEGASTEAIAKILKENDLIDSILMFRITSKMGEFDGTYRHGDYVIQKGLSDESIMKLLQSGVAYADAIKVVVPEGYTAKQIATVIEEAGLVTTEEFLNEMNNGQFEYDFLKDITKRENYLEGYLFPATYQFKKDSTAHDIIVKFLDRFEISYDNTLKNVQSEYSSDEIVIIASLIESEIQVDTERATAAGVIYNRLNAGMPLQIDSTVQYALSIREEVVTLEDIKVDSPYNTYKNKGLPPGPICSPGDEALKAASNPENNNYYYYVVKERGSGEHVFTETYDEFLNAKKAYQDSFNK